MVNRNQNLYLVIGKLLKSFQFQRVGSGEEGFDVSGGELSDANVDELENWKKDQNISSTTMFKYILL